MTSILKHFPSLSVLKVIRLIGPDLAKNAHPNLILTGTKSIAVPLDLKEINGSMKWQSQLKNSTLLILMSHGLLSMVLIQLAMNLQFFLTWLNLCAQSIPDLKGLMLANDLILKHIFIKYFNTFLSILPIL